ncbi:MAG TPA: hypothetical protein VLL51_05755 [Gemmatimonadales bacterium]|nr:hypothetical protein [Gemmatimonadales bacterium]
MPESAVSFYRRWIAANGWSEAAGLGTTFALGRAAAPAIDQISGVPAVLTAAALAVLLGVLLEGALVGWAQAGALRPRLPGLTGSSWIRATMLGAGIAWLLGMVPSTVMSLQSSPGGAPPPQISSVATLVLAAGLGAVTGPVLGSAQWFVLRRHVPRAGHWLWANALAWALGMPVLFAGMDLVPWSAAPWRVAVWLYLVTGVTGLLVGAVHGRVLLALTAAARSDPAGG